MFPITTQLNDESTFNTAIKILFIISPLTIAGLQVVQAPYGKLRRPGWGPSIPAPIAWFVMESPTLWVTILLYPLGRNRSNAIARTLIALYLIHYIHRTILYPLRLVLSSGHRRASGVGFPISIAALGFAFNLLNAYVQVRSASHYAEYSSRVSFFVLVRVLIGASLFVCGMMVNILSDRALMKLKVESGGSYRIPMGGLFEFVACPNYLGEALEWLGFTVIAWTPASLGFFLYTCANLGPRARAHLKWYREKFGSDFPARRKAFIPFVY